MGLSIRGGPVVPFENKFTSSNESSDKLVLWLSATLIRTRNQRDARAHDYEAMFCTCQPHSALVQLDNFSADDPDTCVDASNSLYNIPHDAGSSMLPDSSAFDL